MSFYSISAGTGAALGANVTGDGVNFAVFSDHATRMVLCLFDADGREVRIDLPEREGGIWHGHVSGIGAGQRYGYRAYGPYRPDEGHRFNPNKLLLDPYARQIAGTLHPHDALMGYTVGADARDLTFDTRDSAPYMPRSVVEAPGSAGGARTARPLSETVIYEAHVKGLTRRHPAVDAPGSYLALASDPILDHLTRLGVTAIELLPVHAFVDDRFLIERGLRNYWGYQSIGFFAPEPRYMSGGDILEFRRMVERFHGAGIEVLLDVVYNHTGEGDESGPTLCFRGLDNRSYYRLARDPRHYLNFTGTGNTLNLDHPMVLRMVMDSLRYWVEVMGVDGFRFDLAATLGRTDQGFDPGAAFFDVLRQDPALSAVKLIAEPWDIGPEGYQLGAFPPPFAEWNDRFRDGVRRFWRGDPGRAPDLAARITGSAEQFDHSGRAATSSVNFLTAHDGFTLQDVVSYARKHNETNGEGGRDGHAEDFSDNLGQEGPTDEPAILTARALRKRNMMATLLLSQGTPMLLAGDELGNSQSGNNNAYCQDNDTAWVDWSSADNEFVDFVRQLVAFRKSHPILRQKLFLHSRERAADGMADVFWRRADGKPMQTPDWHDPERRLIAVEMRTASGSPPYSALENAIFMIFNAGGRVSVTLPAAPEEQIWFSHLDTAHADQNVSAVAGPKIEVAENTVMVLVLGPKE